MQLISLVPAERGTYEIDGKTASLVVAWAHIGAESPIVDAIVGVTMDDLPVIGETALMGLVNKASSGVIRYSSIIPSDSIVKR